MKLYNSIGPNPRVVRMFAAEKGLHLPTEQVDLVRGENRQDDYLQKNPHGTLPALELADGSVVSEIIAICEFLEEYRPIPDLIGTTPARRAETRMWTRRIDLGICAPMQVGFQSSQGLRLFKDRVPTVPDGAEQLKAAAQHRLKWLDGQMVGREFVCGDRFTLADILLFAFLDFGATVGQTLDPENANLASWFDRVKARPSTAA